jgi:hypothetical protein
METHHLFFSKNSLLKNFIVVLIFVSSPLLAKAPIWYLSSPDKNYHVKGYGQGATLNEAKSLALLDVARTLAVNIQNTMHISEKLNDGKVSSYLSDKTYLSTSAVISGAAIADMLEENGIWYVSVVFDKRSLGLRFKNRLENLGLMDEPPNFLSTSILVEEITEELGVRLKFKLFRENNLWSIGYKNVKFVMNNEEFIKSFQTKQGSNIKLKLNKNIYYPDDKITFEIKAPNSGYVSLLAVDNDGKVGVLYSNVKSEALIKLPSERDEIEFKVFNPSKGILHEMYVATWSRQPLNLSYFEDVQATLLDDSNYRYDHLNSILNSTDASTWTIKVKY